MRNGLQDPKQAIDDFIERYLKPFLEHEGFKKRARTWIRSKNGYSEIISIQADKWNSRNEYANFFVNYGLYSPHLYEEFFDGDTPKQPTYWDCALGNRVLNTEGQELWSIYSAGRKSFFKKRENIAGDLLLDAISTQALKAFGEIKDFNHIRELHGNGHGQRLL